MTDLESPTNDALWASRSSGQLDGCAELRHGGRLVFEIDMSQRLPAGVADDEAGVRFLDGPGRREAAGFAIGWLASSLRSGALAPRDDFCSIHAHSVCSFNVENLQAPSWISVNREGSI